MTESESWRFSAGQRLTQCRADVQIERRPPFRFVGQTMIRHGSHSGTVTATSFGVHGATTESCLIASPSFPLPIVAGLLRAGVDAIDLASIAPPADKNLRAAATTQEHPARNVISTCGSANSTYRIPALCVGQLWQLFSAPNAAMYWSKQWHAQ